MCGLAAIFAYRDNNRQISQTELQSMRDAMLARGPDGCGLWLSEHMDIGLTHRRLSILDLSERGAQPMSTPDGKLRIVFNGEIYNFRELRAQLQAQGHVFYSDSDTEVLLYAYREYGRAMVDRLRGMFAFAIWDEDKRGVFLARDHFGIKPLYFHDDGSTLRVASQVKAMLAGGGIDTSPEPAGHVGFFLWGCVPEPYTCYRNLYALQAGHTLWVDRNGAGAPHKYFDIAEELHIAANARPSADASEILKQALSDSVKQHLIADVPVGVFLSSGLDSSVLTALAAQQNDRLHAVTLGFDEFKDSPADEVPLARKIAAHYRSTHRVFFISRHDFEQKLPAIMQAMDQPSIDGVNTYFVAQSARQAGLKVALSGVGGDELLAGYPSFRQVPALVSCLKPFSVLPRAGQLLRIVSVPLLKHVTSPKYAGLFEYGGSYAGAYLLRRGLFMPWELPEFLDAEFVKAGWSTLQPLLRLEEQLKTIETPHAKVAALEISLYLRNMLLRDADWAGMAHALEIRTPMVDVDLFRALAPCLSNNDNLPLKRHLGNVPERPLPAEIINRPKTGFNIPVREWLNNTASTSGQRGLRGWALRVNDPSQIGY